MIKLIKFIGKRTCARRLPLRVNRLHEFSNASIVRNFSANDIFENISSRSFCLRCFATIGRVSRRASGLYKLSDVVWCGYLSDESSCNVVQLVPLPPAHLLLNSANWVASQFTTQFTGAARNHSAFSSVKTRGLAVASIARDVGSSSTNRSSDIMHFLLRLHERLSK